MAATRSRAEKSLRGRSSVLNRRSRFHISRKNLEQPAIHEPAQKIHQVGTQQFRFDVELGEKLL